MIQATAITVTPVRGLVGQRPFGVVTPQEFGAVGDGSANDTAAVQAAIDAAESGGGIVDVPRGTYQITGGLVIPPKVTLRGAGTGLTELRTSSGNLLQLGDDDAAADQIELTGMTLRSASGGGHVIYCPRNVTFVRGINLRLRQENDAKSVLHFEPADGIGSFIDNHFIDCHTWHTTTATVATWSLKASSINRNRWVSIRPTFSGAFVWHIESTGASSYANENAIIGVTAEVTTGGVVKALGARGLRIEDVGVYDLQNEGATTQHLFAFGTATAGGGTLNSGHVRLVNVRRHQGTLGTDLFDVHVGSTTGEGGVTLDHCGGATSLAVQANSKRVVVINSLATITNDSAVVAVAQPA